MNTEFYMRMAIALAKKGRASPNPRVGCVIVKDNKIIGRGYHRFFGDDHAEIHALRKAGPDAKHATVFVTLEPCSHFGKTPPCVDALIKSGIKKVVIGSVDTNPVVKGIEKLRRAGITVEHVLKEECDALNEGFFKYIKTKKPFIILKAAMSIDGKIATGTGDSKYISGKDWIRELHRLRSDVDGILVGINTVIVDDPQLTSRIRGGRDPLRIILDSTLKIPLKARVLADKNVLIATTERANKKKLDYLKKNGFRVQIFKGKIDLKKLVGYLPKLGVTSVLVEGGGTVHASFIKGNLVDKFIFVISPIIIGGDGISVFGTLAIKKLSKSIDFKITDIKRLGRDIKIIGQGL